MSNKISFGPISITRRSGEEPITINGESQNLRIIDFWQWAHSDLVSNASRGVFAEFLVASAVGALNELRSEWAAYDVLSPDGIRIEVKSASYLQTWHQEKLSAIRFKVGKRRHWDAMTNILAREPEWQNDVYVFAVLYHQEKATLDPLELSQWEFYVLSRHALDRHKAGKTVGLSTLLKWGATKVRYADLQEAIKMEHAKGPGFQLSQE